MELIDDFGRRITRLRISLLNRCNMNCPYCHHEGNESSLKSQLSLAQIKQLLPMIEKYEISSIKLTGGEPLLHPNIVEIVKILSNSPTVEDISMTSNGLLLEKYAFKLKEAGLNRINIGCDTLYDSSVKSVAKIRKALDIAKDVDFNPIKLNMVILKGINDNEIEDMIEFSREHGFILQIIELIDSDKEFYKKYHLPLNRIESMVASRAVRIKTRSVQDRKQYFLANGAIIEIVPPMHNPDFCANCHTLRVTSDFQFQACLRRTDNFVPISDDLEKSLEQVMKNRRPFYVRKKGING